MGNDPRMSPDYQRAVGEFVGREVIHCASTMVSAVARKADDFPDYCDEIADAFRGTPDYEAAARAEGWEYARLESGKLIFVNPDAGECNADEDEWQELCGFECIDTDDYLSEVFEHWIVSDWLGNKLDQAGERVLYDFFCLTIWCRTTTGQAISMDCVIQDIFDATQRAAAEFDLAP